MGVEFVPRAQVGADCRTILRQLSHEVNASEQNPFGPADAADRISATREVSVIIVRRAACIVHR